MADDDKTSIRLPDPGRRRARSLGREETGSAPARSGTSLEIERMPSGGGSDERRVPPRRGERSDLSGNPTGLGTSRATPRSVSSERRSSGHPSSEDQGVRNPLLEESADILAVLATSVRQPSVPDPAALKRYFIQAIRAFEENVKSRGMSESTAFNASYVVAAMVDDLVMETPWGGTESSGWSQEPVLLLLHNDLSGGERFFEILDRVSSIGNRDDHLLELLYVCLSLGFKGQFMAPEHAGELRNRKRDAYELISWRRDIVGKALSPHADSPVGERHGLARSIPFWVTGVVVGALVISLHLSYAVAVHNQTDPVFERLETFARFELDRDIAAAPQRPALPEPIYVPEREPEPPELPDPHLITFPHGGARLTDDHRAELDTVATTLAEFPKAQIEILGRTDFTGSKQVNQKISARRAQIVRDYLVDTAGLDSNRILRHEGISYSNPLTPEDPENTNAFKTVNRSTQILYVLP